MSTQQATGRCDCGGVTDITATASAYEFDWTCRACARAGVISWAHVSPPPAFVASEPSLFDSIEASA
jgi:hypothetical protein